MVRHRLVRVSGLVYSVTGAKTVPVGTTGKMGGKEKPPKLDVSRLS